MYVYIYIYIYTYIHTYRLGAPVVAGRVPRARVDAEGAEAARELPAPHREGAPVIYIYIYKNIYK